MNKSTIMDDIVNIFISEIEAINNYKIEEVQLALEILHEEVPSQKHIENSHHLTNLIINEEVKNILYEIAIELEYDYKDILYTGNTLNISFLERLAQEMKVYYTYFKLLNRVKREKKGDLQTLKTYLNALDTVEKVTINLNLKEEVKKEINFYRNINSRFKKSKGFIHTITNNKIKKNRADKLELFIKDKINNISNTKTYY